MGGLSTPLRLREKALVPGRPMRAGLLTEGPPLEEDAIVRGSSTPQRNHFRWLMFHSELLALLDTAPFIHHISDTGAEPVLFYTCVAEKILCRTNSPFFPSLYGSMSMCTVCFRFCLQWSFFVYIYHQGLVLLVHRGYSLYEQRFSLSSQITQSLRSQSVYIKTVNSVVQRFTTTYKYEAKILKDNLC